MKNFSLSKKNLPKGRKLNLPKDFFDIKDEDRISFSEFIERHGGSFSFGRSVTNEEVLRMLGRDYSL